MLQLIQRMSTQAFSESEDTEEDDLEGAEGEGENNVDEEGFQRGRPRTRRSQ